MQAQDKQDQLSELLSSYTLHGLPKMPDSLTRGRPHYDQSAFTLERHWTDIVANHDRLNKRQRDQQEAVWELLSTEVEYLRKLRVIIDVSLSLLLNSRCKSGGFTLEADRSHFISFSRNRPNLTPKLYDEFRPQPKPNL